MLSSSLFVDFVAAAVVVDVFVDVAVVALTKGRLEEPAGPELHWRSWRWRNRSLQGETERRYNAVNVSCINN